MFWVEACIQQESHVSFPFSFDSSLTPSTSMYNTKETLHFKYITETLPDSSNRTSNNNFRLVVEFSTF